MKLEHSIIFLFLFTLYACQNIDSQKETNPMPSEQLYLDAGTMAAEKKYDSAFNLLTQAFDAGLVNPMRIISDSSHYYLVDNPKYRKEVRVLLKKHAAENIAKMVRKDEPGTRITVTGKIFDEADGAPIENVIVEIVHTDSNGLYFLENSTFNPRLFAYLRTNKNGQFTIHTIRPGGYLDDDDNPVPAHMHFTLEKSGYRLYASEFTFDDDPIFKANGNVDKVPVAIKIEKDNQFHYKVEINMQRDH